MAIKFNRYPVNSKKDLLHFVEERLDPKVYEKLGKNPERWIEELNIINGVLTGECLCAGIDINFPPESEPEFKKLGERVFIYRGNKKQLRGLWLSRETTRYDIQSEKEMPYTEWTHFRMESTGILSINTNFNIPQESFLPENFEPKSKIIKSNKRPILTFDVCNVNEKIKVYAKGALVSISCLYQPPSFRLTNLSQVSKITSKREMDITLKLSDQGVKVPAILGYYETPLEEFLFLKEVSGKHPSEFLDSNREEIIEQDSKMLAALCLLGYRKQGFEDFNDKLFDGKNLYLIDSEDICDLYAFLKFDFRDMIINPLDKNKLDEFRKNQKSMFTSILRDAIFNYRKSLTPKLKDQISYINTFYKELKLKTPSKQEMKRLTKFPKDYMDLDRYLSMMQEE